MTTYTHTCVKCFQPYQDSDVEAYYCEKCAEEHKALAAQIDAGRKPVESESKSDLDRFLNDPRTTVREGVDGHGVRGQSIFIRESQL